MIMVGKDSDFMKNKGAWSRYWSTIKLPFNESENLKPVLPQVYLDTWCVGASYWNEAWTIDKLRAWNERRAGVDGCWSRSVEERLN